MIRIIKGDGIRTALTGSFSNDWIFGWGVTWNALGEIIEDPTKVFDEVLSGGRGSDRLYGGAGNDTLYGGVGNDNLYGGTGNDRLYGGSGGDLLEGGDGTDLLYGQGGKDMLYGGAGNDRLYGGNQPDLLFGGTGDDWLDGGRGVDTAVYDCTFDEVTFGWSPYGGRLFLTTPAEGTDTLVNVEWLEFGNKERYHTNGVVANDDSFGMTEGSLGLVAADLLANDISLKGGAAPEIVTDPAGLVGTTNEGIDVYLAPDGSLYFQDETAYHCLIDGEGMVTGFEYTAGNGTQYTDTAWVELVIAGAGENHSPTIEATEPDAVNPYDPVENCFVWGRWEVCVNDPLFAVYVATGNWYTQVDLTPADEDPGDVVSYATDDWVPGLPQALSGWLPEGLSELLPDSSDYFWSVGDYGVAVLDVAADTLTYVLDILQQGQAPPATPGTDTVDMFTVAVYDDCGNDATVVVDFCIDILGVPGGCGDQPGA